MKKILLILIALLCLSSCGSKKVSFSELKDAYDTLSKQVAEQVDKIQEFAASDYIEYFSKLKDDVSNVDFELKQEDEDLLNNIYKISCTIKTLVSPYDNEIANKLKTICDKALNFVEIAHDGSEEEFNNARKELIDELKNIENWSKDKWSYVEKHIGISWNEVEDEFIELASKAKKQLRDPKEVSVSDLTSLVDYIIENYSRINNGINEGNIEIAEKIYLNALKLEEYTDMVDCKEADRVEEFAEATQTFIETSLGKEIDEEDKLSKTYEEYLQDTNVWTESIWNQITALLKVE